MCGRYQSWIEEEELVRIAEREKRGMSRMYFRRTEISPGMESPILYGGSICVRARIGIWGYPMEQEDKKKLIFNARAENAASKPMFREDVIYGRIVVPASGYYEWNNGQKYRIGEGVLYFAGLSKWVENKYRYVILTTEATDKLREVHDRMPLLMTHDEVEKWLYDETFCRNKMIVGNTLQLQAKAE